MPETDPLSPIEIMRKLAVDAAAARPEQLSTAPEYGLNSQVRRSWTGWPSRNRPNDAPVPVASQAQADLQAEFAQ